MNQFDFIFVCAGRTGSLAFQNFLSLHPDVFVVPRLALDEALLDRRLTLAELHSEYEKTLAYCQSTGKKSVLVVHQVQALWADSGAIERLSKYVKPNGLIMVVRDHAGRLLSGSKGRYGNTVSGYSFPRMGLPWPERISIPGPLPSVVNPVLSDAIKQEIKATMDTQVDALANALKQMRYFELYTRLSKHFSGNKQVLDFSALNDMSKVFRAIGVNDKFTHRLFSVDQNCLEHRYMAHNNVTVDIFGHHPVAMRISTPDDFQYNLDQDNFGGGVDFVEIASIPILGMDCPFGMRGDRIALGAHRWSEVSNGERMFLHKSDDLDAALKYLFSQWAANVQVAEAAVKPHRLMTLPPTLSSGIERLIRDDTRHLMDLYPQELSHWSHVTA